LHDLLAGILSRSLYLIATKDDSRFIETFHALDSINWSTERLITKEASRQIIVADPPLIVGFDMCRGCPAYCALFDRVYAIVEKAQKNKIAKVHYGKLPSVVEVSRQAMVRLEFVRLCTMLANSETSLDYDALNTLEDRAQLEIRLK
jgi:hypothetical protein